MTCARESKCMADPLSLGRKLVTRLIVSSQKFESIKRDIRGNEVGVELAAKPLLELEPDN